MNYLDSLRFHVGFPNWLTKYDPRRRNQVPARLFQTDRRREDGGVDSQPTRAMFQFHEEYSILIGRLESRDILLANVHR